MKDGRGQPEKPWLTIILDDFSRAAAGYALSFSDPSAIHTALALRQAIWRKGLAQLHLLLPTVSRTRRVHPDGIRFSGLRYIDPTLAAYVREEVLLRYDPRGVAEVRVSHVGRSVCRAVCQELAGETVPLREVIRARERRRRELRRALQDRRKAVELLLEARREDVTESTAADAPEVATEPQRIGFVNEFRALGPAEVRVLLANWRPPGVILPEDLLADAEGMAGLIRITGGNFWLVERLPA